MEKFIIDNQSSVSDVEVIGHVAGIVTDGKISNDGTNYCYVTVIQVTNGDVVVYATKNKKSFKFTVCDH